MGNIGAGRGWLEVWRDIYPEIEERLTLTYTFRVSLQEEEDGCWSAWIDSLPGCADWGHTKDEALEELRKAAEMFVQSMLEHGDAIPSDDIGSTADIGEGIVEIAI